MYKIRHNLRNFERCQRLIELSTTQLLPQSELLEFITWTDRNTLRNACFYRPFQTLLHQHVPTLISLPKLSSSPPLLAKATALFSHLNLYSTPWLTHVARTSQKWLTAPHAPHLNDLATLYKCFVELQVEKEQNFMQKLHERTIQLAEWELERAMGSRMTKDEKLRVVENMHKFMRTVLLDPQADRQSLWGCLQKMHRLFEQTKLQANFEQYSYVSTAYFYELLKLYPISSKLPAGHYLSFLQKSYLTNTEITHRRTRENTSREFQRRGESVFEIRFQRNLQQNGYWFKRNMKIGLSEYDVVIKGRLSELYCPFAQLLKSGGREIAAQELADYQKMGSLWTVDRKERWEKPVIVNLNGPYHFVEGDRQGLTRSEEIKQEVVKSHGYEDFRWVDYRVWERETTNQEAVKTFLRQFLAK